MGTPILKLLLSNQIIDHEYQIVSTEFPIATDGILGRNFFTKDLPKIDYEVEYVLPLRTKSNPLTIPPRTKKMIQTIN